MYSRARMGRTQYTMQPRTQRRRSGKLASQANRRRAVVAQRPLTRAVPVQSQQRVSLAPVAKATAVTSRTPSITNSNNGVRIRHREYILDFLGSAPFTVVEALSLQPGDPGTFPWLSAIAHRYETYSFESLSFHYKTTSATTQAGTMLMAIDFDAADAAPVSKQQAMSYASSVRMAPWQDASIHVKKADLQKKSCYYVRSTTVANTDIKTYDLGNLFLMAENSDKGSGELYVEYDVHLQTPQLEITVPSLRIVADIATATKNNIFGTSPSVKSNFGATRVVVGNLTQVHCRNPRSWLMTLLYGGTGLTGPVITFSSASSSETVLDQDIVGSGTYVSHVSLITLVDRDGWFAINLSGVTTCTGAFLFLVPGDDIVL